MTFIDWCYGVLSNPKKTFEVMKEEPPIFYSFLVVIGVSVVQTVSSLLLARNQDLSNLFTELGPEMSLVLGNLMGQMGFIVGVFSLLLTLFWWFLGSAIYHLLSELLGGKGKGLAVMSGLGLATLPLLLLVPLEILRVLVPGVGMVIMLVTFLIVVYVYLVLPVLTIERVHDISRGRAIGVVLLPIVSIFTVLIFMGILLALLFGSLIESGMSL